MTSPNFFIIGAPKTGTTSLAAWLSKHPEIFMATPKEPRFFSPDIVPVQYTEQAYLELFRNASSSHKAIGEASVTYLRSQEAIPSILERWPQSRFIVCIRSPIEMAISLHSQRYYAGVEPEKDFSKAWKLQEKRRTGFGLPPQSKDYPNLYEYGWMCRLGEQLRNLYSYAPKENIIVIESNNLRNSNQTYTEILDFLGVSKQHMPAPLTLNEAKRPIIPKLNRALRALSLLKKRYFPNIKLGGVTAKILELSSTSKEKTEISENLREELNDYFHDDIILMSNILNKDYTHYIEANK